MTNSRYFYRIWLVVIVFALTGLIFTAVIMFALTYPAFAAPALACGEGVLCVDIDATDPTLDGLSWTTAFTNVQDALNAGTSGVDEIWVAEGVYYPDEGAGQTDNDRTSTFDLGSGVALYGGFSGTETSRDARDWETYVTVLSGDVDGNDSQSPVITDLATVTGNSSNAYHVVTGATGATGTTLDGFTITAGYADGGDGGGIYNVNGNPTLTQLTHLIIRGNRATSGGGLYFEGNSLVISNTTFVQNTATNGGGMFVASNYAPDVVLTNTTFLSNTATTSGGGLETQLGSGSITLTDVTFTGNKAMGSTGPSFGGGMHLYNGPAMLNRVFFEGNESAHWGGGFHLQDHATAATATMNEVSFIGNTVGFSGGGIGMGRDGYLNSSSVLNLTHGIFINNSGGSTGGGGMWQTSGNSTLADVMFSQNEGKDGGGLQVISGTMMLSGATIAGNTAESTGGGIRINAGNLTVANSILWGNTATGSGNQIENGGTLDISYSDIQESSGGGTNIDADPLFVDAANDDLRLSSYLSPAFNAGNSLSVTTSIDLAGNPRIAGAAVDMGAYEIELAGPTITLQKSVTPTQYVTYHGVVTYTLVLANVGVQSDTVTLTDTLPTSVAFGGWVSQPAGAIRSGDALTWTGAITADETITLAFTVTHTGDYGDIITNTAYFSGTGQTGHKAVTFAVNRPPTADAGSDQSVRQGKLVQLDGSRSSDPEGHALTYSWTQTGGPAVTLTNNDAASPTFTANDLGIFTFTLTVTDSFGLADATPDTVVITVLPFLGVLYVDADSTDPTIGVSWTTAFTNVQDALNVATSGDEIWVAEGVYYPDEGAGQTNNDRNATFDVVSGVAFYGGFSGTETSRDARDWETYITVLSGDLDQNDSVDAYGVVTDTTAIAGSNAYHVVTTFEVADATTLDGFTITAGYADFDDASFASIGQSGGGMLNYAGDFSEPFSMFSTPQVSHVIFSGNYAKKFGGGMSEYTFVGATLTDITFVANRAGSGGGGLYIFFSGLGYRDSQFEGLTFVANHASYDGGGLFIQGGHLVISNTTFVQNTAAAGGGMLARAMSSVYVTLMNTTFLSNTAVSGGGGLEAMSVDGIIIQDVTFTGNKAAGSAGLSGGGGMYLYGGPATLNRVVFENNECTNTHSYGGGVDLQRATATMNEVSFIGNTARVGGGINVGRDGLWDNSVLNLTHGIFINNSGWWNGGGGMRQTSGNSTLADVMFSQNEGNFGGGLFVSGGTMMLSGATIANNTAEFTGGGIHIEDSGFEDGILTVANSILWGNTATESGNQIENRGTLDISYSDIQESGGGGTNIDANPLFVDAANDDLRLSYLSPAIDAGNNLSVTTSIDLASNPRIVGAAVDMGAYELAGPIITLQKSVTPTQDVPYHGVVTYTLALANIGVQSDIVTLTDTLPNDMVFGVWVDQPMGTILSGNTLTWTGDIIAEESIILAFTAIHTSNDGDMITNTAYFSGTDHTGHDTATFVLNQPPIANAGLYQVVAANSAVILDGTGSSDPEGTPLAYYWVQTGGSAVSFTPTLSVTTLTAPASTGMLTFTLTVTDTSGLTNTDVVTITVGAVWDGESGDNKWSTAVNWVGDVVPTAADVVLFNETSNEDAVVDPAFGGTVAGVTINTPYMGTISFTAPLTVSNTYAQANGTVILNPALPMTVNGTVAHTGGILQETKDVASASTVNFLQIQTSGGVDVYRGVDLTTTTSDLGDTTVTIKAVDMDTEFCTTDGAMSPDYAGRCYTITPTNNLSATVTLWALTSELPITVTNPSVYHYVGTTWTELANTATDTSGSYTWVSGDTTGFSPFLMAQTGAENVPTAVSLQSISTGNETAVLPIVLIATLLLVLLGGVVLRRRAG